MWSKEEFEKYYASKDEVRVHAKGNDEAYRGQAISFWGEKIFLPQPEYLIKLGIEYLPRTLPQIQAHPHCCGIKILYGFGNSEKERINHFRHIMECMCINGSMTGKSGILIQIVFLPGSYDKKWVKEFEMWGFEEKTSFKNYNSSYQITIYEMLLNGDQRTHMKNVLEELKNA
jgi:hypothetical protein